MQIPFPIPWNVAKKCKRKTGKEHNKTKQKCYLIWYIWNGIGRAKTRGNYKNKAAVTDCQWHWLSYTLHYFSEHSKEANVDYFATNLLFHDSRGYFTHLTKDFNPVVLQYLNMFTDGDDQQLEFCIGLHWPSCTTCSLVNFEFLSTLSSYLYR